MDMLCQSSSQPSRRDVPAVSPFALSLSILPFPVFSDLGTAPISPPFASLCFQALTHCPVCNSFFLITLRQYQTRVGASLRFHRVRPALRFEVAAPKRRGFWVEGLWRGRGRGGRRSGCRWREDRRRRGRRSRCWC